MKFFVSGGNSLILPLTPLPQCNLICMRNEYIRSSCTGSTILDFNCLFSLISLSPNSGSRKKPGIEKKE
jgi:hypothetical protein